MDRASIKSRAFRPLFPGTQFHEYPWNNREQEPEKEALIQGQDGRMFGIFFITPSLAAIYHRIDINGWMMDVYVNNFHYLKTMKSEKYQQLNIPYASI